MSNLTPASKTATTNTATIRGTAAYDVVGNYQQDAINGLSDELLETLVEMIDPQHAEHVLDAMAGDGNLTLRMAEVSERKGWRLPKVSVLEYSKVQCEFARRNLKGITDDIICGDMLSGENRETGEKLPDNHFDRVVIKSANHEIPLEKQAELYRTVYRILRPGGLFINLGFLYDDKQERDEMRAIAYTKDELAGMTEAVKNRHFMTRSEFFMTLKDEGFEAPEKQEAFSYRISSRFVDEFYFKGRPDQLNAFHDTQRQSEAMVSQGNLLWDEGYSTMVCPGEISVMRKASLLECNDRCFKAYPYDFVRKIKVHAQMLDGVASFLPSTGRVLDVGCGLGLLAERLKPDAYHYEGIDASGQFVEICQERFSDWKQFDFLEMDANDLELSEGVYDAISMINVIYIDNINPLVLLQKAFSALRPGGQLIVTGPITQDAFDAAEPMIREQLTADGALPRHEDLMQGVVTANEQLLNENSHYYSAEGLAQLMVLLGYEVKEHQSHYFYNNAYMVVAQRPS